MVKYIQEKNILIEVPGTIAEQEREMIRNRQAGDVVERHKKNELL